MDTKKLTAEGLLNNNVDEMNTSLTGNWMQITVSIRRWDDRARDEVLSDEIKNAHNVQGDNIGTFFKKLMGDARYELDTMNSHLAKVRTIQYAVTKKLGRDFYVAPISDLPEVILALTEAKAQAEESITKFLDSYNQRIGEAQTQLGTMATSLEYPNEADIRAKIGVSVAFTPLPDMNTFKGMAIPAEVAASFAASVGNQQRDLVTSMVSELYDDLIDSATHLAGFFKGKADGEKGSKLYASRVSQIQRLAGQLQSAEGIVTSDFSNLSAAVNELAAQDFDAAKVSLTSAAAVQNKAQGIVDKLAALSNSVSSKPGPVITPTDVIDKVAPSLPEGMVSEPIMNTAPPTEPKKDTSTDEDAFAALDSLFY